MSHGISIDTLKFANRLKKAGVSEKQAEVHVQLLAESFEDNVATKDDLEKLKLQLTLRMGAMITAAVGILATLMKFFQ